MNGVGKIYPGGTRAITDVNLEIEDGEFVVLVGPSGCGKSTLLRMVAGLEEISEGEISIGENVVNDVPPKDRNIAMVFQNYALYPHMSVFDNMAFGLKLRKMDKGDIDSRVRDAARTLEITDYLDRKPKALSGGQRQRVAIGRAIVRGPEVFLFDEPLSNLDAELRVEMRVEIARLHNDIGATMIYVTHDQVEAMTMGDRVAVIRKGILQQADTPRFLYDKPANLFVAGFIGSPSMNFVYGTVESEGESVYVKFGNDRLRLDQALLKEKPHLADHAGQDLIVGLRPEYFELADALKHDFDEERTMTASAELVEQLGSEAFFHFHLDTPPVVTPDIAELLEDEGSDPSVLGDQTKIVARVDPDKVPAEHQPVKLVVETDKLHFFDKETGEVVG